MVSQDSILLGYDTEYYPASMEFSTASPQKPHNSHTGPMTVRSSSLTRITSQLGVLSTFGAPTGSGLTITLYLGCTSLQRQTDYAAVVSSLEFLCMPDNVGHQHAANIRM
jgi:hypothetical protein